MRDVDRVACIVYLAFLKHSNTCDISICVDIARRADDRPIGQGRSTYARARRAEALGRCPRCFRVKPGFYFTKKCDGVSCTPNISYNHKIEARILNRNRGDD